MKKILFTLLIISLILVQPAFAKEGVTILKFNTPLPSMDPNFGYWSEFCQNIEDESNGTLNIQMYASESLGKAIDMVEATTQGAPVLQDCDPTHLADYVPDFAIFMHPYLFTKPEDIEKVWKSEIGQNLSRQLEAKGLRIVTLVYFGTRNLISNKAVYTREDTKNMKIRCAATKMWIEVAKVLGGNPTNTAWSEVYTALSQGVADAAESPVSLLYSCKLYEACKNISLTEHLVASTSIIMSQKVYENLPPEAQAALDKVGSAYPPKRIALERAQEDEFIRLLKKEGVKFNEVDKSAFMEAAKSVSQNFPEWTPNLYNDIRAVIENK